MKKRIWIILLILCICSNISFSQELKNLEMILQRAHTREIKGIDFTSDGKYFVSATEIGEIKFWNQNGILFRTIFPPSNKNNDYKIHSIAISPDGERIAAMQGENYILVWKLDGSLISSKYKGHNKYFDLKYSSDSKTLIGFNDKYILFMNDLGETIDSIKFEKQSGDPRERLCKGMFPFSSDRIAICYQKWQWYGEQILPPETFVDIYTINDRKLVKSYLVDNSFSPVDFKGKFCASFRTINNDQGKIKVADILNIEDGKINTQPITQNCYSFAIDSSGNIIREFIKPKSELGHELRYSYFTKFPDQFRALASENNFMKVYDYNGNYLYDCGSSIANKLPSDIDAFGENVSILNNIGLVDKLVILKKLNLSNLTYDNFNGIDNSHVFLSFLFNPNFDFQKGPYYYTFSYKDYIRSFKSIDYSGQQINNNAASFDFLADFYVSANGTYLVYYSTPELRIYDSKGILITKKDITDPGKVRFTPSISFTKDGNYLLTYSNIGLNLLNKTGKSILSISSKDLLKLGFDIFESSSAAISPNGDEIAFVCKHKLVLFDLKGKIKKEVSLDNITNNLYSIEQLQYTNGGDSLIGVYHNAEMVMFDKDGREIRRFKGHEGGISNFKISKDGKTIISTSVDQTVRFWNIKSGEHLILLSDDKDWIIYTPDGYFDASRNGGKFIGMTYGVKSFGFDQFAVKYNRPDILLKRLSKGSTDLISHFENQYKKRLRKLGLTEERLSSDFHVPTSQITSTKLNNKHLSVNALLNDEKHNLTRYNIYVNDVPIFGAYGKEIGGKKVSIQDIVELTSGNNKIEVSCINEQGVESYRALAYANCNVESKGNLYLLAFGVSKYNNESLNLQFADKDALDLEKVIQNFKSKGFENVYTKVLTNEQVTPDAIKASKDFVKNAKVDDTFILFIAGHGMHDKDAEATYYYLTSNADVNNLKATAADFETIEDLLQGIPPRNKLFLMDACESGEIDDEDQGQMIATATGVGIASRGFKTKSSQTTINDQRTTKRSYLYQKDRYIYNDLVRRSGSIVFSSSKGGELSYERSDIENGLFTEYIMKALTTTEADKDGNGTVSTDELREYVSAQVAKASGDLQHPTVDRDNIYQKFGFTLR